MSDVDTTDADAPAAPEPLVVHGHPATEQRGQVSIHVDRSALPDVVRTLRDDHGFNMCLDVTAVDYSQYASTRLLPEGIDGERFEVVVSLISHANRDRIRIRVQVPDADPTCPTLFHVHPGTEAMEREVYDLMGIRFDGHPDLTRILMPEDWEGHPLRKDYSMGRIPVQFKGPVNER